MGAVPSNCSGLPLITLPLAAVLRLSTFITNGLGAARSLLDVYGLFAPASVGKNTRLLVPETGSALPTQLAATLQLPVGALAFHVPPGAVTVMFSLFPVTLLVVPKPAGVVNDVELSVMA